MAKQYTFGTGNLYMLPSTGIDPIPFGAIQDVSVDFSGDTKTLYGQNAFPLDTARAKVKITGKATFGQIDPVIYNTLFFGGTVTTGEIKAAFNEGPTVIPATPFQITVANAASFKQGLGVFFAATGVRLTQVATGPITGQYSLNAATGVYTFATADTAKTVVISYLYNSTTTGQTLNITNVLMGTIPVFQIILANNSKGKSATMMLNACTSSKLSFPFKQDDYLLPSIDFNAQDDGTGTVGALSFTGG